MVAGRIRKAKEIIHFGERYTPEDILNNTYDMVIDGIKSKYRVDEHGEVFTPESIVNDMLDLVYEESYRLESTFLEPACGNGNFLVKILERKLKTAWDKREEGYDRNIFIAVSSIYAIDILVDNINEAKVRMLKLIIEEYSSNTGNIIPLDLYKSINYVMDDNIIFGDSLTGERCDDKQEIIIAEWRIDGDIVTRVDEGLKKMTGLGLSICVDYTYEPINFRDVANIQMKPKVPIKDNTKLSRLMEEFSNLL